MYAPEFKFMPPPTYTEVSPAAAREEGPGGSGITRLDPSPASCSAAQVDPCINNKNNNVQ